VLVRSRRIAPWLTLAGALAVSAPVAAAGICTINVLAAGTMRANPAIDVLGTKQAGGAFATATVTAIGVCAPPIQPLCPFASVIPPTSFAVAPSGGNASVTFDTSFRMDGGAEIPANTPVAVGVLPLVHSFEIEFTAAKTAGVFPAGNYQAVVTLLCE
jgi:hypothetical protein